MLESGYEACLTFELLRRDLKIERQKPLPLLYKEQALDASYRKRIFLLKNAVVVEVKSIERLERVHSAQLLSYLPFTACHVRLLFNFNVTWLARDGLRRVVNRFPE